MTKKWIFRFPSLAVGMVLLFSSASSTRAQCNGIPILLVEAAIHDYQSFLDPAGVPDREWNPRKALVGSRVNPYPVLASVVYTASLMDMSETRSAGPNFREQDPLARPLLGLPTPLYIASGLMLSTAVNWWGLQWRHSPRFHKVWWLPQVVSIGANLGGFEYTRTNTITIPNSAHRAARK